ncbi:MAG: HIT family protein [Candidatus Dormibacteraeota bacterium]|nr:HIT family protein [Candidatus Dormibacteraeota bacterium]
MSESRCPICSNPSGRPVGVVAELAATWVTAVSEAPLPGYVCVVAKRYVTEPYELVGAERVAFWNECLLTAEVLAGLYQPLKMNYEIHGNTIPHLHMHLYPRYRGDPYEGGPIDGRVRFGRTWEEVDRIRTAINAAHGIQSSHRNRNSPGDRGLGSGV